MDDRFFISSVFGKRMAQCPLKGVIKPARLCQMSFLFSLILTPFLLAQLILKVL